MNTITNETVAQIKQAYELNFHIYDNPVYVVVTKFSAMGYDHNQVRSVINKHMNNLCKHN